jgi:aminopeptidase YwaD
VTAAIPGADTKLKEEEIAFSCHLDHQRPGANDNASGCATILEVARTLQKLIVEGKVARPARTIQFIFPPEIEGTLALLNGKPEFAKRIKAVVHMDMVGGGPETKAVFHVTRGPMSLPSFVQDVAWAFAEWVNEESYKFAATGKADYPLVSGEGGKEPLRAEYSAFTMGSDHDVYQDSSFGIPAIYLNDWPDRFIHTNLDSAANMDATKLKRAGFIGAASGYFLAGMNADTANGVLMAIDFDRLLRGNFSALRASQLPDSESSNLNRQYLNSEIDLFHSVNKIFPNSITLSELAFEKFLPIKMLADRAGTPTAATGVGLLQFRRKKEPKGPMAMFGFDYFEVEWAKRGHTTKPKLLEYEGLWGGGEEYVYEVLNFADGKRNAREIRDAVSAEYGPVPLELVVEYLRALEEIEAVEKMK